MKAIVIEIGTEPVKPGRSGQTKTGQPYTIPDKQDAFAHVGKTYPVPFEVPVVVSPYRPGFYLLAGDCLKVGQYGAELDDRAIVLVPVADAMKDLEAYAKKAAG